MILARLMRAVVLFFIVLAPVSSSFAGTAGKIVGTVVDASSGDPLVGVNVVLEGTHLGSATDLDGFYYIINVPPGTHVLRVSAVGYQQQRITGVKVIVDQTTRIDVQMQSTVIQGEVVEFVAKRPIIEVDRTFATSTVAGEDLQVMPVTRVQEAVDVQAGVVDGHFRGGRSGEVVYMLDGVPIVDTYDNTQATIVNQGVVQELQVITGTFNAEYGQAMSGVVNLVSKEGGESYHGRLIVQGGDFLSTHDDIFYNIDDLSPLAIQNYEGSVSGPVPFTRNLTFFLNGRLEDSQGWMYGQRRWGLEHPVVVESGTILELVPNFGDSAAVPMNPDRNLYLYGKVTYHPSSSIKVNLSSLWDDRDYKDYDHDYQFIPDGDLKRHRSSRTNIARLTWGINQAMFLESGYSNTFTEYHHYVFEDPYDPGYVNPLYLEINPPFTLKVGGTKMENFRRWTNTHTFQSKLSWQVNSVHFLVTGFSLSYNTIFFDQLNIIHDENFVQPDTPPSEPRPLVFKPIVEDPTGLNHDQYLYNPYDFALYAQDKIELKNVILNLGVRFDYFQPDGKVLADPQDPNVYNPILPAHRDDPLEKRLTYWYKDPSAKMQFSPRIGIGYPISPTGVLHFAYGHFFQRPKYESLYTNPEFELDPGTATKTLIGNADLEPEKTISYEFGLQQGLTEDLALSISIFQRDIRYLTSSDKLIRTYDAGKLYFQYTNRDFGEVRGFVLTLDKRYSNNISASIDYTFQVAQGNASDPSDAFNAAKGNKEPVKQLLPLDWDRRHTLNMNVNYVIPDNFGVSFIGTLGSGLPFTRDRSNIPGAQIQTTFENDGRKPSYINLDLNAFKVLPLFAKQGYQLRLELMVRNVFDRLNENDVFKDTGRATYTLDETNRRNQEIPYINTFHEVFTHPEYYSRPREVRVGLSFVF